MRMLPCLAALPLALVTAGAARASTFSVIHTFQGGADGAVPLARLTADAQGNLYGTTSAGGGATACAEGCGTVFRLSPSAGGGYAETVLHAFQGGADGADPVSEVALDAAGNIYGTTAHGGGSSACDARARHGQHGCGTVYQIGTDGGYSVLHAFAGPADGGFPRGGLLLARDGRFFGTTTAFGSGKPLAGNGTMFTLTASQGGWTFETFRSFSSKVNPAVFPFTFTQDGKGWVYGPATNTYQNGGKTCFGGIASFNPFNPKQPYFYRQSFCFSDPLEGIVPSSIIVDNGIEVGALSQDATSNAGAVFAFLDHGPHNPFGLDYMITFHGSPDVAQPVGLVATGRTQYYGASAAGGVHDLGTVFGLSPPSVPNNPWPDSILWSFSAGKDGKRPAAGPIMFDGTLFGTTSAGGAGFGTVYGLVP